MLPPFLSWPPVRGRCGLCCGESRVGRAVVVTATHARSGRLPRGFTRTGARRRAMHATVVGGGERGVLEVADGACGASWRNVSWCAGCVMLVVAEALGWSRAGVVQRGDVPGARSGPIWGLGLVSFVLMAGLQSRAKGRRDVGCRGGWAPQIDTGSCTRPNTCTDPRLVPSERRCARRGVLWLGGGGGRCGDHPVG